MILYFRTARLIACVISGSLLIGCTTYPEKDAAEEPLVAQFLDARPTAPSDLCWDKITSKPVTKTVETQILVHPAKTAADGSVVQPAIYRASTEEKVVTTGVEKWFQTPCAADKVPDFTASLQRALKARGIYQGVITGKNDAATRNALQAYQTPRGLASATLSISAGRALGLVKVLDAGGG